MLPLPPSSLMTLTLTLREATGLQQRLRRPFCRINTQQRRCRRCCRRRAPSPKAQLALSLSLIILCLSFQKRSSERALFQSELTAASRALAQLFGPDTVKKQTDSLRNAAAAAAVFSDLGLCRRPPYITCHRNCEFSLVFLFLYFSVYCCCCSCSIFKFSNTAHL